VTVLVAGVLFLITILLVFGLTTTDTLRFIQLLGYVMVPLANVGFMVYLAQKLESLGIAANHTTSVLDSTETRSPDRSVTHDGVPQTDGGVSASSREGLSQLAVYDGFARSRRLLRSPLQTLLWNPARILYVTVPIALLSVLLRAPPAFRDQRRQRQAARRRPRPGRPFGPQGFAITRTIYAYRVRRIEAATPEFLERLASLNEAGMTLVESLERLRGSDVGALSPEVERIWADVRMGSNLDDALVRFGRRVRTTSITRVVTLVTNAMRASGSLGPVLRIAATQARADQRLRRRRRQQMLSYLVVIYVSFMVFLIIIVAVQEVLVPALPSHVPRPRPRRPVGWGSTPTSSPGSAASTRQPIRSPFSPRRSSTPSFRDSSAGCSVGDAPRRRETRGRPARRRLRRVPAALLARRVDNDGRPAAGAESVTVESASLSEGGYVVLYLDDRDGPVVGQSAYLGPGTHRNVEIQVDRELPDGHTLVAVAYQDSDGDRALTLGTDADQPLPGPRTERRRPGSDGNRRVSGHRRVRNGLLLPVAHEPLSMTIRHNDLAVDWLGYATLRIEGDDSVVYMDPGRYGVLSGEWGAPRRGYPTPAGPGLRGEGRRRRLRHAHSPLRPGRDPPGRCDDATVVLFGDQRPRQRPRPGPAGRTRLRRRHREHGGRTAGERRFRSGRFRRTTTPRART